MVVGGMPELRWVARGLVLSVEGALDHDGLAFGQGFFFVERHLGGDQRQSAGLGALANHGVGVGVGQRAQSFIGWRADHVGIHVEGALHSVEAVVQNDFVIRLDELHVHGLGVTAAGGSGS